MPNLIVFADTVPEDPRPGLPSCRRRPTPPSRS